MIRIDAEFKSLLDPLEPEEYAGLEKSIIMEGCRDALVLWGDILVDGHNRYEICNKHGFHFNVVEKEFANREDVIDWIISNQLDRRNLRDKYKAYLRGKQYEREKKRQGTNNQYAQSEKAQNEPFQPTADRLAEQHNVSRETIKRDAEFMRSVDEVVKNTSQEMKQIILGDEVKLPKRDVVEIATYTPEKQKEIIYLISSGEAKGLVDANRQIKREEVYEVPTIQGKYRVIYADPPWCYGDKRDGNTTGAEDHYPSMSIDELCELPVKDITDDNSVLFMWVTSPLLEECFPIIKAWGFKYKTSFVWDKVKHNMGHYNSVRHELLLVCTKGSCLPDIPTLYDSVVMVERSERHSEKPIEFLNIIDDLYQVGNRIELFARDKRKEGWDTWGNQI